MANKIRIVSIEPIIGRHALQVEFGKGEKYSIDLESYIREFSLLKPLEDLELFSQVKVGEWGFDVTWGDELEIAATTLHRMALEQAGEVMPTSEFKRWMIDNKLSLSKAATELGFSRRTITAYSSGAALIPKHVALACKGWEARHFSRELAGKLSSEMRVANWMDEPKTELVSDISLQICRNLLRKLSSDTPADLLSKLKRDLRPVAIQPDFVVTDDSHHWVMLVSVGEFPQFSERGNMVLEEDKESEMLELVRQKFIFRNPASSGKKKSGRAEKKSSR